MQVEYVIEYICAAHCDDKYKRKVAMKNAISVGKRKGTTKTSKSKGHSLF